MPVSRPTTDWRPLALVLALTTALYAVLYRFVPFESRALLLWPFGALALYSGARLRWWQSLVLVLGVQMGTDLAFYINNQWEFPKSTYLSFTLFALLGVMIRPLLRGHWTMATMGVGSASIVGYAVFFLLTNAEAWAISARPYYAPHTFASLLQAYGEGLEFLRNKPGEVFGNPLCVGLVFGLHAVLARAYFPAERLDIEQVR